jgi:hypothetical protein
MPCNAVTVGSGPFDEAEFDSFLNRSGVTAYPLGTQVETLILGRTNWEPAKLDSHVETFRGRKLRVYSQEMFLAYLSSQRDPHDDGELLIQFGRGHPALEYLLLWGFRWPDTAVVPGAETGTPSDIGDWPALGLLKYMGYSVGENGLSVMRRQEILENVFEASLPNVQSREYMAQWGIPGSSQRLKKLANTIASFARNARRRNNPPEEAIRDWEYDLAWLRQKFYHGVFCSFTWPSSYFRNAAADVAR